MGQKAVKNLTQRKVTVPALNLGLDWTQNEESIPDAALVEALNVEYNHETGALRTVEGIAVKLDHGAPVDSLFHDTYNDVILYSSYNGSLNRLYQTTESFPAATLIGNLAGNEIPIYEPFNDKTVIASGGQIQLWDGASLTTITSPTAKWVTEREARVCTFGDTTHPYRLNFSGTLDPTNWTNTPGDNSSAQYVDVGDTSPIIAVDKVANDLIIYKTHATYRLTGKFPDWVLIEGPRSAKAMNKRSAVSVGTSSYFVGSNGFLKLQPTDTYSDIDPFEEGLNINAWIARNTDITATLWHVPSRKQIWIKTQNDNYIYLYHYLPRYPDGRGAFTERLTTNKISDVCDCSGTVYLACGNKICVLDVTTDKDDGEQIVMSVKSKRFLPQKIVLVIKYFKMTLQNILPGIGEIRLFDKPFTFALSSPDTLIWDATEYIGDALYPIGQTNMNEFKKFGLGSGESAQIYIKTQTGAFEIRTFDIEMTG
jgi:hypothetical protein